MIQNTQTEQAAKIGNWIATRLDKYELVLLVVFVVTYLLKAFTELPTGILIVLSLMSLAMLYFFSAFGNIKDEYAGSMEYFLHKLSSWACSITIIGILFAIESWHNSKLFLLIGSFTLVFVLPLIFYNKSKKAELKFFNTRYIFRIILVCCAGLILAFAINHF